MQDFITPTQIHSQAFKISAPCSVLFVVCSYLCGISRGIEIAWVVFTVLVADVRFSLEGKSIVRPLMENSKKMSGKKSILTAAAIALAVPLFILEYSAIFLVRKSSEMQLEQKIKTKAA